MIQAAPPLRAQLAVLNALPSGEGRDLFEAFYGGWLENDLWETYGNLDAQPRPLGSYLQDQNTELRLYARVGRYALQGMTLAGASSRAGTHFRIAAAVIGELRGDQTRTCPRCNGTRLSKMPGRIGQRCRTCKGTGLILPSMSSRAEACQCRRPEFRDNLAGVYLTLLARLRRELANTTMEYRRAEERLARAGAFALDSG